MIIYLLYTSQAVSRIELNLLDARPVLDPYTFLNKIDYVPYFYFSWQNVVAFVGRMEEIWFWGKRKDGCFLLKIGFLEEFLETEKGKDIYISFSYLLITLISQFSSRSSRRCTCFIFFHYSLSQLSCRLVWTEKKNGQVIPFISVVKSRFESILLHVEQGC